MELNYINPHIRFTQRMNFSSGGVTVFVRDFRIFYITDGCARISAGARGNSRRIQAAKDIFPRKSIEPA